MYAGSKSTMTTQATGSSLLMFSHCLPDARGDADRARAWQLLRHAAQTHRVHLLCLHDAPVCLAQWRAVNDIVDRIVLESPSLRGGPTSNASRVIDVWQHDTRYDAALATHAMWDRQLQAVRAGQRFADLQFAVDVKSRRVNRTARLCDRVFVASACDAMKIDADAITILPQAVDLPYFEPASCEPSQPKLAIHTDGRRIHKAARQWFVQRIWPKVRAAVPQAVLEPAAPDHASTHMVELNAASVVVAPSTSPQGARWSTMRAMAMARAVVATHDAAVDIGARHGEELLLAGSDRDWVEHCVEALRSASCRIALAERARLFIETHHRIHTDSRLLFAAAATEVPLAKAA